MAKKKEKQGKIISLSGIDGAGKSTQVKMLSDLLKKDGKQVKVTQEMFGYFLLKPIISFLRFATDSPKEGPVTRNKKNNLLKLWFILAFLDIWIGYILKTRPMLRKYDYVIADRFYSDIWANLLYYGYLPNFAFVLVKILPRADKSMWLSVSPKVVLKRETEFPASYYNEQAKIYKKLANEIKLNKINANQDKRKVSEAIKALITKIDE